MRYVCLKKVKRLQIEDSKDHSLFLMRLLFLSRGVAAFK